MKKELSGEEIVRYIRENPGADLTLEALCRVFATNRTTLAGKIREISGLSPGQFVLRQRLEMSREELAMTDIPLARLAEKYGFSEDSYYIRAFRRQFGQTPHQFRLRKGKKMLNERDDFRRDLEYGLGRAVVRLRRQEDQSAWRGILLDYVRDICSGKEENHIIGWGYLQGLVDSFADREALLAEIAGIALTGVKAGDVFSMELLKAMGYDREVLVILEQQYRQAYDALVEWLEASGEKLTMDADQPLAHAWYQIAAALCRYPLPRERHKQIILDRAGLFAYEKVEYGVPHIPIVMLNHIWDKMGRDYLWELMDEVAAEHPWGEAAHLKREFVPAPKKREVQIPDSAQLARAAREIADGNVPDERKLELLDLFVRHHSDVDPPDWPLSAGPLIELDRRLVKKNGRKDRNAEYPQRVLVRIQCPVVREYGQQLWETGDQTGPLLILANYTPADRELLEGLLHSADKRLRQWSMWQLVYLMEKNTPGLPEFDPNELMIMGEKLLVSRPALVKAMFACGRVDDELAGELLFDGYREVRELAKAYFAAK